MTQLRAMLQIGLPPAQQCEDHYNYDCHVDCKDGEPEPVAAGKRTAAAEWMRVACNATKNNFL